ncbi:stemmadenine O-acetyltransferase-like [Tripterygium wilfordii]|uniref:stemmadenine O-acetyltransferase-like n=1 Tax=Tripterygium wilfordii TaxID=458696 RepID=UPI0018F803B7|nr:stemmadenine O-acetyltransferase-like [Tripterygium wilfordii]
MKLSRCTSLTLQIFMCVYSHHYIVSSIWQVEKKTMEIEILSRENIKPSSPTPTHLRTHVLSLLDQVSPPVYHSCLIFYSASKAASISNSQRSQVLKQSLSRTLTLYYPLAGRNIDKFSIDCNDEGISYTVAKVGCKLCDYLKQLDFSKFPKLVPEEIIHCEMTPGCHVVKIQETMFACGGFALGVGTTHNIIDVISLTAFLNAWGSMAREGAALSPDFNSSYIFPQNKSLPLDLTASTSMTQFLQEKRTFVGRRFVFEGPVISYLKAKATRLGVQKPTRAEVVVALLFKCIISASKAKSGGKKKSALLPTSVNLRRRAAPKFPDTSVGNILLIAPIKLNSEETDVRSFVSRMRDTFSPMNGDFVKSLQGEQGLKSLCEYLRRVGESYSKGISNGDEIIVFTSWCNSGTYSIDFGWGKPVWYAACVPALGISASLIQLVDTRSGDGIEAWVSLEEEIMGVVERDKELLSVASVDPSPLEIDSLNSKL